MSPQIRDDLLGDILVDVFLYGETWDIRPRRASRVFCHDCGKKYPEMHWVEFEPGVSTLVCPCGAQFPLSILDLSPWEPPPWKWAPSDGSAEANETPTAQSSVT
jgi:hypothetical protein